MLLIRSISSNVDIGRVWIHISRNHVGEELPRLYAWGRGGVKVQLAVEYYIDPLHLKQPDAHTHASKKTKPSAQTRERAPSSSPKSIWGPRFLCV